MTIVRWEVAPFLTLLTPVHKDGFPETMQDMFQSYFVCVCRQSDAAGLVGVTARPLGYIYFFSDCLSSSLQLPPSSTTSFSFCMPITPNRTNLRNIYFTSPPRGRRPAQSSMYPKSNSEALAMAHYPRFTEKDVFDERGEMGWLYLHPDDISGFRAPRKELTLVMQPADPTTSVLISFESTPNTSCLRRLMPSVFHGSMTRYVDAHFDLP